MPALAMDPAGDLSWDPPPLPDLEPEPNELDELKRLPLDPHSDAELLPEEEPDRNRCGEGDLACLHLDGEHTAEEEVEGRPSRGSASASLPICLGAVEVEAGGPVLTAATALPPVLQRIASLKTSSAFLRLSRGGVCARSRL